MTAVTRYGSKANLPTSGLTAGELLFTTDRQTLHAAQSPSLTAPVVPAVDDLVPLMVASITQDYLLVHDADAPGVKEKKLLLSDLRTALAVVTSAEKAAANGVATLGADAKVPTSQLPDAILGTLQYQGTWDASTNTPGIPAATSSNRGRYYVVSVAGTTSIDGEADWQIGDWIVSSGTSWGKVDNSDKVSSVAGRTGAVVLSKSDVGLGNAENKTFAVGIGDALHAATEKATPVDTDELPIADGGASFSLKKLTWLGIKNTLKTYFDPMYQAAIAAGTTSQYWRGDKSWQALDKAAVGLGSVDNTADSAKPVSTPQQTALNAKFDKAGGTVTGATTFNEPVTGKKAAANGTWTWLASTPGSAQGERSCYSFKATFQNTPGDNGPRRVADIIGGFDGGNWGTEYLAFGIGNNTASNDSQVLTKEWARFNGSGKFGLNTPSPTARLDVNDDHMRLRATKTPASATATGNQGDICWDSSYLYVCVATDTWKRVALSTW